MTSTFARKRGPYGQSHLSLVWGLSQSFLATSESVSDGHPDKLSDQISDVILNLVLAESVHDRLLGNAGINSVKSLGEEILRALRPLT